MSDKAQRWIEAGLNELAGGGVDAVRVEVLADRLGVTKGGFYRQFKDRRALLEAILDAWVRGRSEAIENEIRRGGGTARKRLKSLVRLYFERVSVKGMSIELAVRQWARTDSAAAEAAARVDAARLRSGAALYRELGFAAEEAQARAVLLYAFLFGQSLLFLDQAPRKRISLNAAANILMEIHAEHS
jgi:AcrR family transcriptional regulator